MRRYEQDERSREMEPRGRVVVYFLMLPIFLIALLAIGCGDSSSGGTSDARTPDITGTPGSGPGARPARSAPPTSPKRPTPPTSPASDDGSLRGDEPGPDEPGAPVSFARAEEAYDAGRHEEAVELFSAYVEKHPENPWGHYMAGLASWKAGELERAEASLKETIRLDSGHAKGWINLARVQLDQGRPGEARSSVGHALDLDPLHGDALRVLGRALEEEGKPAEAIDAYRKAIVVDPGDAWSMNNLALVHIRGGDFEDALQPLAMAVRIRDHVPEFQNNLGVVLEKTGRFGEAADAYRKADELADGYEKAAKSLARVDGLREPDGLEPTNLEMLAEAFMEEIKRWADDRVAMTGDAPPDSASDRTVAVDGRESAVGTTPELGASPKPDATPEPDATPKPDATPRPGTTAGTSSGPEGKAVPGLDPEPEAQSVPRGESEEDSGGDSTPRSATDSAGEVQSLR